MRIYLLIALFCYNSSIYCQENSKPNNHNFLKLSYLNGLVLQTDDFLRGSNETGAPIDHIEGLSLEFGWQSSGSNVYDGILNYPTYGIGFNTFRYPQTTELGNPNALYLFMDAPFRRWGKFALKYVIRLGLSYNWTPSDPVNNPFNLVVGSYKNLLISAGVVGEYSIANRWDLGLSVTGAHFSNGQSTNPNSGLNYVAPSAYLKYHFNDGKRVTYDEIEIPRFKPTTEFYFTLGSGTHQEKFRASETGAGKDIAMNYSVYNLSIALQRQPGWSTKFGGGIDLIYNGFVKSQIQESDGGLWEKVRPPLKDRIQVGIFGSIEWVLNNVSIYAQPGYRIIVEESYTNRYPNFYQHLAVKYHIENLILGMGIRATDFTRAEYLEWNLGYRIRWTES